ncbi:hypothetical protein BFDFBN_BFDFBN_06035, partial [Dysosmobacter welbionis]
GRTSASPPASSAGCWRISSGSPASCRTCGSSAPCSSWTSSGRAAGSA